MCVRWLGSVLNVLLGYKCIGILYEYHMAQNFDRRNIDKFDIFLSIRQHFSPSKISADNLLPFASQTTYLCRVLSLYSICAHAKFFLSKYIYGNSGLWLCETTACIPNRSAKLCHNIQLQLAISYISMVEAQKCHNPQSLAIYFICSLYYSYTNQHLQPTEASCPKDCVFIYIIYLSVYCGVFVVLLLK